MSISTVRGVSILSVTVPDSAIEMADKAPRPRWNGAALTRHRKARDWSVEDLARILGASPGLIYKWEASESMPKADWLAALVLVFDVPAIRFFDGLDEFQARLKGKALIARPELPIVLGGQDTGAKFLSTAADAPAAPRAAVPARARESPPAAAKPDAAPKHGRRSPKRRS